MYSKISLSLIGLSLALSACSKIPSECQDAWNSIEKMAKESGIPEDALKAQKKEFEAQLQQLSKEQAIQACNAQNSVFGSIK